MEIDDPAEKELEMRKQCVRACRWLNSQKAILKRQFFLDYAGMKSEAWERARRGNGNAQRIEKLLHAITTYQNALQNVNLHAPKNPSATSLAQSEVLNRNAQKKRYANHKY